MPEPGLRQAALRGLQGGVAQIRAIFAEHTPLIEPLSLDEAYLDVTENIQGIPLATEVAKAIRAKILAETGLTGDRSDDREGRLDAFARLIAGRMTVLVG